MRLILKICALAAAALISASYASAGEVEACAKYQRKDGSWSHGYKLRGFVMDGEELNQSVGSTRYQKHANYFVVAWRNGGYTSIRLEFGEYEPPQLEKAYYDQRRRTWSLRKGWHNCN